MTSEDLLHEIDIEIDSMARVVDELTSLRHDVGSGEPTVREKTAAAAFLAQFYGGIENILKRISLFEGVRLPSGDSWHIDLFNCFRDPPYRGLPLLFDAGFAPVMASFRKFRHVVHHGYGFQMDWERLREGIVLVDDAFRAFQDRLLQYRQALSRTPIVDRE